MRAFLDKLARIRLRFHTSWLVIGASMIVLAVFLLLQLNSSRSNLAAVQQVILNSELAATSSLLNSMQAQLVKEDWSGLFPTPAGVQSNSTISRVLFTRANGDIVFDSAQIPVLPASYRIFVEQAAKGIPQAIWLPNQDILLTAIPLMTDNSHQAVVFLRLIDHQRNIEIVRQKQIVDSSLFVVFSLAIIGILLLLTGYLYVRPLSQLDHAAEAIAAGGQNTSIPPMPTLELHQLKQSVIQMVEQINQQHKELEDLNKQLEERVKRRTGELQNATLSLKQRAVEMQSLNILINSAFNAESLQELADHAVRDAVRLMQANSGEITISGAYSGYNMPASAGQLLTEIVEYYGFHPNQEILFHDWQSPTLPPRLIQIGNTLKELGIAGTISLPVLVGRETIGRLSLASSTSNRWQERDLDLARIIGRQLGAAAERLQAFEDSQLNNRLMAKLIIYSERLNRNFNLCELVAAIGNAAQELTGVKQSLLYLLDPSSPLICSWHSGLSEAAIGHIDAYLMDPQNADIFRHTSPMLLKHPESQSTQHAWLFRDEEFENIEAVGILPLIYESHPSALILVFYQQPAQWKRIELEIYQAFTRQAAIALENAHLLVIERDNRNLAEALRDVASALNSTLNANDLNDRILKNLSRVLPHDAADIMMIDDEKIDITHTYGYPEGSTDIRQHWPQTIEQLAPYSRIVDTGQALVISDTYQSPDWSILPDSEWIRSWAAAPIRSRSQVIGFVNVCSRSPGFFNVHHGLILQTFADQASIAIENARLYSITHRQMTEAGSLFRALTPMLIPGSDLATLAKQFVHAVQREFNVGHCAMFILDEEVEVLNMIHQAGWVCNVPHPLVLAGNGLTVTAARTGKSVYAPDVRTEERYISGTEQTRCELAIPFKTGSRVLGVLNLESDRLDAFDEQSRNVLKSLVEQASLVIENNFLLEDSRRNARQTEILNDITQISLQSGKSRLALQNIVEKVGALLQADGCYITAWDETNRQTYPLAGWGAGLVGFDTIVTKPSSRTLTAALLDAGHPLALDDVQTSGLIDPEVSIIFPLPAFLGAPLIAGENRLGAILVGFNTPHHFSRREITLIEQAAAQIALALAKMESLALAQRQVTQSEKLRQATTALTTTLDFQEVVQRVKSLLPSLLNFDDLTIFEIHEHTLKPVAQHNIPVGDALLEMEFPITDDLYQEVLRTKQPLALDDAQVDQRFKKWGGTTQIRSFLCIPLLAGNQIVGILSIGRHETQPFTAEEIVAVRVFANQAGVALQNALLHAELHEWAMTDPLTGLYNRRGFYGLARHEMERSRRFDRPLTVLMLDIDLFKRINDTYGHPVGDVILQQLAVRFRGILREVDLICRYGGEEFCILLPESDPEGALQAAERIVEDVRTQPFETRAGPLSITISVGLSCRNQKAVGLEELLDQADKALLHAKNTGRDRVCTYPF